MSNYDINKARQALKDHSGTSKRDPFEFVPPKVKRGEKEIYYRFFILAPYSAGDQIVGGPASTGLETFFIMNGTHFHQNQPLSGCPRIIEGEECDICSHGFDLMKEAGDNKARKSEIAKVFMPGQRYAMNIYFPKDTANPEALWGKVMWFNAPKTVYDECEQTLMRENGGDDIDPKAFGIFFDETNSILFQLKVAEKNGYNSYEGSKFLPKIKLPIGFMKDASGKLIAVPDKIAAVLCQRHNLSSKIATVDYEKIKAFMNKTLGGGSTSDSSGGGQDNSGFDNEKQTPPQNNPPKQQQQARPQAAAAPPETLVGEGADLDDISTIIEEKKEPKKTTTKAKPDKVEAPKVEAPKAEAPKQEVEEADFADIMNQISEQA